MILSVLRWNTTWIVDVSPRYVLIILYAYFVMLDSVK